MKEGTRNVLCEMLRRVTRRLIDLLYLRQFQKEGAAVHGRCLASRISTRSDVFRKSDMELLLPSVLSCYLWSLGFGMCYRQMLVIG